MNFIFVLLLTLNVSSFAAAPKKPVLKDNEFAVFKDEKYEIFKTQKYESLELTTGCFSKGKIPSCDAYKFATQKFNLISDGSEYIGNLAAKYCTSMSGKAVVGVAKDNSESDLCIFSDGSAVKSWGAYYLHYPVKVITK